MKRISILVLYVLCTSIAIHPVSGVLICYVCNSNSTNETIHNCKKGFGTKTNCPDGSCGKRYNEKTKLSNLKAC